MEYAIKVNNLYESIVFHSMGVIQTLSLKEPITLLALIEGECTNYKVIPACNTITKIDLPVFVNLKLISKSPFLYTGVVPRYLNKHKIEDYLYEITYGNIDYDYAYNYFKDFMPSACSAIRNGLWFGRNFDWLYNNQVSFIVHTPKSLERHEVLGVASNIPNVLQSNVDNDNIIVSGVDMFKLVPFYLVDGINDCGLFCTHNLVPIDEKQTAIIYAIKEEKDKVCIPMLPRFILDKFCNAEEAIQYLINYTTLYFEDSMLSMDYQSHFMIGDPTCTYIVEFINGEVKVTKSNYITNFPIYNVQFNSDNTIIYPPTSSGINQYGTGLERWDVIVKNYDKCRTKCGMRDLLESIKFSNTYEEPFWYSELVRFDDDNGDIITVDTDPLICTTAKANMLEAYENRDRDNPGIFITTHSSIYDVYNRRLYITNQEGNTEYSFRL